MGQLDYGSNESGQTGLTHFAMSSFTIVLCDSPVAHKFFQNTRPDDGMFLCFDGKI